MKFKLDENLPAELCADVRNAGHEADTVADEGLAGTADAILLERIRADGRVLLTLDKGIGDLRAYPPERYAGIVVFRPTTSGRGAVMAFVRRHLPALLEMDLTGRLVVVSDRGVRLR
jgi:predicted nuclease of predicted toxin-antitoxin system